MSQWGEPRTIDGLTMVPLVAAEAFEPATLEAPIERLYLVNVRTEGTAREAVDAFEKLNRHYTGMRYVSWLQQPPSDMDRATLAEVQRLHADRKIPLDPLPPILQELGRLRGLDRPSD